MHNPARLSMLLAVLVAGAGCQSTTEIPRSVVRELAEARARWAEHRPANYRLTVSQSCECLAAAQGPVLVTVRNGIVESRVYTSNGAPVSPGLTSRFPSVDELFELIESSLEARVANLRATYDTERGFPVYVFVDTDALMIDEEQVLSVFDFQELVSR